MSTDTARIEVTALPALDTAAVDTEAEAAVAAALAEATDAEERLRLAGAIVRDETAAAAAARTKRDAAAYTLDRYYHLRRGADLAGAMGFRSRSPLTKIRERYDSLDVAGKFKPVPRADKRLPQLAREAALHAAKARHAEPHRDAAIQELLAAGWSHTQIGDLIGRDQSRVSHVKFNAARDTAYAENSTLPDGRTVQAVVDGYGGWKKALDKTSPDRDLLREVLHNIVNRQEVA